MITYDLECRCSHVFEAWFKNQKTFEKQLHNQLILCPECGTDKVKIVYRASVLRKGALKENNEGPAGVREGIEGLLRKHFEDVGERFADEARQMHFGEGERRNILGRATADEERELTEEGVSFFRLSIPKPVN